MCREHVRSEILSYHVVLEFLGLLLVFWVGFFEFLLACLLVFKTGSCMPRLASDSKAVCLLASFCAGVICKCQFQRARFTDSFRVRKERRVVDSWVKRAIKQAAETARFCSHPFCHLQIWVVWYIKSWVSGEMVTKFSCLSGLQEELAAVYLITFELLWVSKS